MWVRSAAIRPVPPYARLERSAIDAVEIWLGYAVVADDGLDDEMAEPLNPDVTERRLAEVYEMFEHHQPVLAHRIGGQLVRSRDEMAAALGYFLSLVLYKAFADEFGERLLEVDDVALTSVEEALALDEELRGTDPVEAVDSDDVIAMEQPHVLNFMNEHIEAALDPTTYDLRATVSSGGSEAYDVDVDAVHAVYRTILIELLALSYSVAPPPGLAVAPSHEIYA